MKGIDVKINFALSALVALALASPTAFAQDPAYLKQLDAKSDNMKRCGDIARWLEKVPVPPNHADQKAVAATQKLLQKPVQIDPVHAQFEATVKAKDQEFRQCGIELFKDLAAIDGKLKSFMEQAKKQKLKEAEEKAIAATLTKYMAAKEDLHEAVQLLSKDLQMQAYVHKTLVEHYLNQKF